MFIDWLKNSLGKPVNEFGVLTALPLLLGAGLSAYTGWFVWMLQRYQTLLPLKLQIKIL